MEDVKVYLLLGSPFVTLQGDERIRKPMSSVTCSDQDLMYGHVLFTVYDSDNIVLKEMNAKAVPFGFSDEQIVESALEELQSYLIENPISI